MTTTHIYTEMFSEQYCKLKFTMAVSRSRQLLLCLINSNNFKVSTKRGDNYWLSMIWSRLYLSYTNAAVPSLWMFLIWSCRAGAACLDAFIQIRQIYIPFQEKPLSLVITFYIFIDLSFYFTTARSSRLLWLLSLTITLIDLKTSSIKQTLPSMKTHYLKVRSYPKWEAEIQFFVRGGGVPPQCCQHCRGYLWDKGAIEAGCST